MDELCILWVTAVQHMVKKSCHINFLSTPTPKVQGQKADLVLEPWSHENPGYVKFANSKATIEVDFRKTYSTKGPFERYLPK